MHNVILKPFMVGIIQYVKRVHEMHYISMYPPPNFMKGDKYDQSYCAIRDKLISEYEIRVATNSWLPTSMQDEMRDKAKDYRSLYQK